jgi:hypothetical protein
VISVTVAVLAGLCDALEPKMALEVVNTRQSLASTAPPGCVIDGEIVIAGRKGLDFDALQLRLHPRRRALIEDFAVPFGNGNRLQRYAQPSPRVSAAVFRDETGLLPHELHRRHVGQR